MFWRPFADLAKIVDGIMRKYRNKISKNTTIETWNGDNQYVRVCVITLTQNDVEQGIILTTC